MTRKSQKKKITTITKTKNKIQERTQRPFYQIGFPKLRRRRVMDWDPSPTVVCQSLGSVKPSVWTPPSPNEVTVCFSKVKPLSARQTPADAGCGSSLLPPPRPHSPSWNVQDRGRIQFVCFFVGSETPLVVSCPPWRGLIHWAGWAEYPPPPHELSAPNDSGSPWKQKGTRAKKTHFSLL